MSSKYRKIKAGLVPFGAGYADRLLSSMRKQSGGQDKKRSGGN